MSATRRESIALGALGAVAGARTMLSVAPLLRFDSDPALVPGALAGIGPGGSLLLDAIGAAALVAVLASAWPWRQGTRLLPLLVLLPIPAFLFLALGPDGDFANLWRGASWIVAALAAAVIAGRGATARTIIGAVLIGAVAAMIVRGASQLLIEHREDVAYYEETRDTFLAARGWSPDSAEALAYERRLRQSEASGWFGLANVYSGILGASAILLAAMAWAGKQRSERAPIPSAAGLLCAVLALGAASLVLVNGGKGAIGSMTIGALTLLVLARRRGAVRATDASRVPVVLLAMLVLLPFVVIFVRGAILGETALGERSLLFRWQYLLGALRIVFAHPLTGVGVEGFQEAYSLWRPWFSPEEVVSAHSSFMDWLAAFGMGAVGLIALSFGLLWRALRNADLDDAPTTGAPAIAAIAAAASALLAVLLTSPSDWSADALGVRLGAGIAAVVMAAVAALIFERGSTRIISAGFGAAALALLIHGQLDMAFWLPGSTWWCWLLLGAAAAGWTPRSGLMVRVASAAAIAVAGAAAIGLGVASLRAMMQERRVEVAAREIELAASNSVTPLPRSHAAEALADAARIIPGNARVWQAAVEQALLAAQARGTRESLKLELLATRACELADEAFAAAPGLSTARLLADARYLRAIIANQTATDESDPQVTHERTALLDATNEVLRREPRSLAGWIRLAEVQLLLGDAPAAATAAKRALEVNASYVLDPLRQLTPQAHRRLKQIMEASKPPKGTSNPPLR